MSLVVYLIHTIMVATGVGLLVTASMVIDHIKDPELIKCTSEDCLQQQMFWLVSAALAIISSIFATVGYFDVLNGLGDNEEFDFQLLSLKLCPWNRIAIGRTAVLFAAIVGALGFGLAISHFTFLSHLRTVNGDYSTHALAFIIISGMIPSFVVSVVFIFYTCFIVRRSYESLVGQTYPRASSHFDPVNIEVTPSAPPPYNFYQN